MALKLRFSTIALIAASCGGLSAPVAAASKTPTPAHTQAPAPATQAIGIVAKVNNEIITAYDLDQVIRLRLATTKQPYTPQAAKAMAQGAIDALVERRLEEQEIKRLGVKVTDKDIDDAIGRIVAANKLDVQDLYKILAQAGVEPITLRRQIAAELGWNRAMLGRYAGRVYVGQEQIQTAMDNIKANAGKPQSLVSEIFIAVDNPQLDGQAQALANNLFEQLKKGAPFPVLARQYSNASSAATGGDIGWILPGQLAPELDKAIDQTPPNSLAPPVRGPDGWYIIGIRDRRQTAPLPTDVVTLELKQIMVPMDPAASDADLNAMKAKMIKATASMKGCEEPRDALDALPQSVFKSIGALQPSQLPQDYQTALAPLSPGEHTQPIRSTEGLHVLMLCDRKSQNGDAAVRAQVEDQLLQQQLGMLARRTLRDLRRQASVEINPGAVAPQ